MTKIEELKRITERMEEIEHELAGLGWVYETEVLEENLQATGQTMADLPAIKAQMKNLRNEREELTDKSMDLTS